VPLADLLILFLLKSIRPHMLSLYLNGTPVHGRIKHYFRLLAALIEFRFGGKSEQARMVVVVEKMFERHFAGGFFDPSAQIRAMAHALDTVKVAVKFGMLRRWLFPLD